MPQINTIIVGGGQAGLALSYYLLQQGREHLVLEQATQVANTWRNQRWDSFTFVTPNWAIRLPGAEYQGDAPDGYMPRNDIVAYFEQYMNRFAFPIRFGTRVASVEPKADGDGYLVRTDETVYDAANVVIATGLFQNPKIPPFSADLPAGILQLHSSKYRNPQALPSGAVLVVGTGQSGCQIAEELYQSGRTVYQCVGSAGRAPRRYRGKDVFEWLNITGFFDRTVDKLPSPKAKFLAAPQISGRDGGHTLNLHQFARDGVVLLGRILGAQDSTIKLAPDLRENLTRADKFEAELVKMVDEYIARNQLDAPEESLPNLRDGFEAEIIEELNLKAAGINTIIWAMGYSADFSLIRLPILDSDAFPVQKRGVTAYPGLYFVGLPWLDTQKTGLLLGVGDHAALIASEIAARDR
ncbi:MAG: NAD(P)-binding domain-containing protein [Anaerolineae bacterium]|nr:NAD(P)-binding domain-containing protein [Anaerolineae bacterium]